MINLAKKFCRIIEYNHAKFSNKHEDQPVLDFLSTLEHKTYDYLEIASGRGRFPLMVKNKFQNFDVSCLEINHDLVCLTSSLGLKTIEKNILENDLISETFDIIHASHIIEHFSYPNVIIFLDELFRLVKKGGYIIIRSPLMHNRFYHDIDHVRPYPPESIFNYFFNDQQQKVGESKIRVVKRWCRKTEINLENSPLLNLLFKILWLIFRFPRSRSNGYVLILQKI